MGPKHDFAGAHVLVTGGTSGIGAATARLFRDAGADVTITGTRGSASEYDADLSGYRYCQLDVENKEQIDAVAASLPRDQVEALARAEPNTAKFMHGMEVRKVIIVPGKIVNIVAA